ncbi:MAG: hypothetical protein GF353_28130 [Candidatus Lokiarchaeota archaeon]|nr:hypothetical protein [Candidatus Lokiarchaeota archaeon]
MNFFEKVKHKGIIDEEIVEYLENIFSNNANKVFEVIERGITKYKYIPSNRTAWVALGENREHLIYPMVFCSCQDFYKNVVIKKNRVFCKHLLAQIICSALKQFQFKEVADSEYKLLIKELKLSP